MRRMIERRNALNFRFIMCIQLDLMATLKKKLLRPKNFYV